jgi:endonuclease G
MEETMLVNRITMARARLALQEAVHNHLSDPNVTLIEFGLKERGNQIAADDVSIRIHVRQKLAGFAFEAAVETGRTRPIPPSIGGFQTDVSQGTYQPHWWSRWRRRRLSQTNLRATRVDPMRGGISISNERHHAHGTLGTLVIDRETGAEMILSNWHVLAADWRARPGSRIYQPGRLDGGTGADTIATLTRHAMSANLDAAVATLSDSRGLINEQFELGQVQGVGRAELGLEVVKSGRRTGITYGRIIAVEGVAKIRYGHLERIIRHVLTIEPRWNAGEVSAPGDSGSIWLDQATMQTVGLHFAGSNFPERGLALDMTAVLDALNINIVAGATASGSRSMERPEHLFADHSAGLIKSP